MSASASPSAVSPRFAALSDALHNEVARGAVAGLVALVQWRGEEVLSVEAGWRDRERGVAMTRDTICRLASMSKPLTSVAALCLHEEGLFELDDPIARWMPEFAEVRVLNQPGGDLDDVHAAPRGITIRDLLTHRSGLPYSFTTTGPLAPRLRDLPDGPRTTTTPDDWLAQLGVLPLVADPGTRWIYGVSTDVLGFLLGRIAGGQAADFRDVMMSRVLGPLGMTDTDFYIGPEKLDRLATLYRTELVGSELEGAPDRGVTLKPIDGPPPGFDWTYWSNRQKFLGGGGSMVGTADDYLRFAAMLMRGGAYELGELLTPASVAEMTRDQLTPKQKWGDQHEDSGFARSFWTGRGFGLGVAVIEDEEVLRPARLGGKGAFYWNGAYGTTWVADPGNELAAVLMVQLASTEIDRETDGVFRTGLYDAIRG